MAFTSFASAEYRPCFQLALRDLSSPSGVLGPVDFPPCRSQRPLRMADRPQGCPARVLAPQVLRPWGSCFVFSVIPRPPMLIARHGL